MKGAFKCEISISTWSIESLRRRFGISPVTLSLVLEKTTKRLVSVRMSGCFSTEWGGYRPPTVSDVDVKHLLEIGGCLYMRWFDE